MRCLTLLIFLLASLPKPTQNDSSLGAPPVLQVCGGQHPTPCATTPHVIFQPGPEYSEEARKKGLQGTVVLELMIGPDGTVQQVTVLQPLGMGLDEESVKTAKMWRFEPGTSDGKPVAVKIKAEMTFNLLTDAPNKKKKKQKK